MNKGFTAGEVQWDMSVLESLRDLLQKLAPEGEFQWTNKQLVHFRLPGRDDPWATIYTKKADALTLQLNSQQEAATLGQIVDLADEAEVKESGKQYQVKMAFSKKTQISSRKLKSFLKEHLDSKMADKS